MMKRLIASRLRRPSALPQGVADAAVPPDPLSCVPLELHILILAYFEPRDLASALNVCRSWRYIWQSPEIWPKLADRWLPGLAEHIRQTTADDRVAGELFRQALQKAWRRVNGRFVSAVHHRLQCVGESFFSLSKAVPADQGGIHSYEHVEELAYISPDAPSSKFMMYNNGRMAFWPQPFAAPYLAVVDDFRTRIRRAYLFPNYSTEKRGHKTAMSDKLLLMGRERIVHAWHLDTNELQTFELAQEIERAVMEGETALFVCKTSDVFYWKFGGPPQRIDMNRLDCYEQGRIISFSPGSEGLARLSRVSMPRRTLYLRDSETFIDFIVHPTLPMTFFIITLSLRGAGRLVVYEVSGGKMTGTYPLTDPALFGANMDIDGNLRWEKINSYGGYCLITATMWSGGSSMVDWESLGARVTACHCKSTTRGTASVCFNIYTKRFEILYHHWPHPGYTEFHLWNGRMARMAVDSTSAKGGNTLSELMSIRHCADPGDLNDPKPSMPLYLTAPGSSSPSSSSPTSPEVRRRHSVRAEDETGFSDLKNVEFLLDPYQQLSPTAKGNAMIENLKNHRPFSMRDIKGDDDFLIFVHDEFYSVWSFADGIPAAKPVLESEKKSRWWKAGGSGSR
ncbi:hypothetical protein F4778DRAFT_65300 [Xylariomycetidae sp. FL2044]|nr:hypothetical protein F4778DRAFT_65300 [Xylariomycetidae sp. FL2044]